MRRLRSGGFFLPMTCPLRVRSARPARVLSLGAIAVVASGLVCAAGAASNSSAAAAAPASGGPLIGMETGHAAPDDPASSKLSRSPCGELRLPTWSPDGKQIAAVGHKAICVMDADGRHLGPLPSTDLLIDTAFQLVWVRPSFLLYDDLYRFFVVPVGATKPKQIGHVSGDSFSVSATGNRFAVGVTSGQFVTAGPVRVLKLPSGAIVGRVGGRRLNNVEPSLSPNGMQVVFVRNYADESGRTLGIWTAWADGSHLRQLAHTGSRPLWSPAGGKIAYLTTGGIRLVSPHGGASKALVSQQQGNLFAWSPNGKRIAFSDANGRLTVVQVATGNMRKLLTVRGAPSVAWSPNSQQLLVSTLAKAHHCYVTWRVPAGGGKPKLLHGC